VGNFICIVTHIYDVFLEKMWQRMRYKLDNQFQCQWTCG
jgi:hypothetical protein